MLNSGHLDCGSAANFVERIPAAAVQRAEESLLAAITICGKQALEAARTKLQAGLDTGVLAPRALMALMEATGARSAWSQAAFAKMFSNLPDAESTKDPSNYAAMFVRMAPEVSKEAARDAGVKMLEWLSKVKSQGERNLSVNMISGSLQELLGNEGYAEALRSNVVAQSIAQTAGQAGEADHPEEESVSVLQAMDENGADKTREIADLPASKRAREAAAHGFAAGTSGNKKLADRYFDLACSAVNEVWDHRTPEQDAPAVVEEVSEAAAQSGQSESAVKVNVHRGLGKLIARMGGKE